MSKSKIIIGVAALALGAAFASVPAFAQSMQKADFTATTRGANDGGMVGLAVGSGKQGPTRQYYNYAPRQAGNVPATAPHPVRAPNDGGPIN